MANAAINKASKHCSVYEKLFEDIQSEDTRKDVVLQPDVVFLVGNMKNTLAAHRAIVSIHSITLSKMLNGSMSEALSDEVTLPLTDLLCEGEEDCDTFKKFVKFCYCGKVEVNKTSAVRLLELAHFLQCESLVAVCAEFMNGNVNQETVCSFLEAASRFELDTLKKKCSTYMSENTSAMLSSGDFVNLSRSTLTELLRMDLQAEEIDIFKAVLKWGKALCEESKQHDDLAKQLEDVVPLIRFSVISLLDHAQVVLPSNVVPTDLFNAAITHQILLEKDPNYKFDAKDVSLIQRFGLGLKWDHKTKAPNTTLKEGGSVIEFKSSSPGCAFGNTGFSVGVHSWTICWETVGCCGYAGIASEDEVLKGSNSGNQGARFLDPNKCIYFTNGSSGRVTGKTSGTTASFVLDCSAKTVRYKTQHNQWTDPFSCSGRIYPALWADQNSIFRIEYGQ